MRDVDPAGLNFITLASRICICLTEEEKIELFSRRMGSSKLKIIEDRAINGDMMLSKQDDRAIFSRDNKLYRISMK